MAEILSFSKARKIKARNEKEKRADENRVKFGRTKAEKNCQKQKKRKTIKIYPVTKKTNDQIRFLLFSCVKFRKVFFYNLAIIRPGMTRI